MHADGRVFIDFLGFISGLGVGEEAALANEGGEGQVTESARVGSPLGTSEAQPVRPKVTPSCPPATAGKG